MSNDLYEHFRTVKDKWGQATARHVLEDVAGVSALSDVPGNKLTATIAALRQVAENRANVRPDRGRPPTFEEIGQRAYAKFNARRAEALA